MFEFVAQHQFGAAVAITWIFSAAVSSLPEPDAQSHPGYLWLYRFAHTIAGNITTAFGSRIPGLKVLGLLLVAASLMLPAQGCAKHYNLDPAALNETLLIAETVIDQTKAANRPPDDALQRLIESYDNLKKDLVDLTNAIRAFGK